MNPCESGVYEHRQRVVCPPIEGLCLASRVVSLRDQQTFKPNICSLMQQSDHQLWLGSAADPASFIVAMVLSVEAMIGEQVGAGRGSPGWLLLDEVPDILLIAKHFTAVRSRAVPRMLRDQLS